MTRDVFTRWTCNVCGKTEETKGGQPTHWVGYGFTQRSVPAGEYMTLGHLCPACHDRITNVMEERS